MKLKCSDPAKVVTKAIKDAALGNEISVYGVTMKVAEAAAKILPHKVVMKVFDNK